MWTYDKKLQFPVNIKQTNSKLAKAIITQYGGADCVRYDIFETFPAQTYPSKSDIIKILIPVVNRVCNRRHKSHFGG